MKLNPNIIFRDEFDGHGVIFNPEDGQTFGLNPTAAMIYRLIGDGKTQDEILKALNEKLEEVPENAARELAEFIQDLQEKGYLEL